MKKKNSVAQNWTYFEHTLLTKYIRKYSFFFFNPKLCGLTICRMGLGVVGPPPDAQVML